MLPMASFSRLARSALRGRHSATESSSAYRPSAATATLELRPRSASTCPPARQVVLIASLRRRHRRLEPSTQRPPMSSACPPAIRWSAAASSTCPSRPRGGRHKKGRSLPSDSRGPLPNDRPEGEPSDPIVTSIPILTAHHHEVPAASSWALVSRAPFTKVPLAPTDSSVALSSETTSRAW